MKNHISVKFIAVLLCSLMLMTAVFSGLGIGVLAASDLYNRTVGEVYNETFRNLREGFAYSLVFREASMYQGGCSSVLVDLYYDTDWFYSGTFRWGSFAYVIRDSRGNVITSSDSLDLPGAVHYEIPVINGSFLRQVPAEAVPELTIAPEPTEAVTLPEPTEAVTLPVSTEQTEPPAETEPDQSESAQSESAGEPMPQDLPDPAYTGAQGDSPSAHDRRFSTTEQYANAFPYEYYDYMQDQTIRTYLCYDNTSEYTVDLYLQPDAMLDYQMWEVLGRLWSVRNELFVVLGISLLIFAALAVYLCCAAGQKPGSQEVRPGALNRLPLDFYAAGAGFLIAGLLFLNRDMLYSLFWKSVLLAGCLAGVSCFAACLLAVGFGFAFAAQVKTAGGFWWKNSVIGRCLLLLGLLWKKFCKACMWLYRHAPAGWQWLKNKAQAFGLGLYRIVRAIVTGLWKAVRALCVFLWELLQKFMKLLPLIWQWLLAAGIVVFDLVLTISTGDLFFILLGLAFCLVVVFYGAISFGTLLTSARRMQRGDLETKVNDRYLVGCFQSFAEELNGLADVAVVAAQKEMKSERMKTELITNVSHDIKTPLTSIINYVDLLKKPHTEQQQEEYLEVLSRQSSRLKKLIDDLMEMSKASTGNVSVDITTVDAAEAVNQALGEFVDKLEKAQLTPVFRQPEDQISMKADGRLVWRVLSNLLGNAVKYALPGTRLYIDVMELDGKVLISMKNISRDELNVSSEELLERFVRGDVSRNTEGSGLGLNIAKSLMELQHGRLELLVDGDLFKVTLLFPAV